MSDEEKVEDTEDAKTPTVVVVQQTETCKPCNEEHPRGEPCPKCGRSLLLG